MGSIVRAAAQTSVNRDGEAISHPPRHDCPKPTTNAAAVARFILRQEPVASFLLHRRNARTHRDFTTMANVWQEKPSIDVPEHDAMAIVLEARHGIYAAEVADFFSAAHFQKGDEDRSNAW